MLHFSHASSSAVVVTPADPCWNYPMMVSELTAQQLALCPLANQAVKDGCKALCSGDTSMCCPATAAPTTFRQVLSRLLPHILSNRGPHKHLGHAVRHMAANEAADQAADIMQKKTGLGRTCRRDLEGSQHSPCRILGYTHDPGVPFICTSQRRVSQFLMWHLQLGCSSAYRLL